MLDSVYHTIPNDFKMAVLLLNYNTFNITMHEGNLS